MEGRLRQALLRAEEVGQALGRPDVARDPAQLKSLGREHTRLAPIVRLAERLARLQDELAQARELADEADPELAALARADLARLAPEIDAISRASCTSCCCPRIRTTTATRSSRSAPAPAVTRRRSSRPISTGCTSGSASGTA